MSGVELFRTMVGAMIAQGFAVDSVRDGLDLKGASEVWGGPETDDHPAWYFWLTSARGAYRLRLEQTEDLIECPTPAVRGVFSVKYYPAPGEPVFRHFSDPERALVEGPLFDRTNTPTFDAQAFIPEPLFNVGAIGCIKDLATGQVFLEFTSIDRLRFFPARGHAGGAGAERPENGDGAERPEHGDGALPVRQLPAWDVGYPLFDALVGLQAFQGGRPPKRIVLSRQAGFEFVATEAGGDDLRDSRDATFKSLLVAFFPETGATSSPVEAMMISRQVAEPWTPVLDTAAPWLAGHGHGHGRHPDHCHGHGRHHDQCHHHHGAGDGASRPDAGARTGAGIGACGCAHDHRMAAKERDAFLHPVKVGSVIWEVPLAFNAQWWALTEADRSVNTMPCGCH